MVQSGKHLAEDVPGVEARLVELLLRRAVADEAVGQEHGPDLEFAAEQFVVRQILQQMRAEAAYCAVLDDDQDLVLAGEPADQRRVEGLGEAGIGDGGREPVVTQLLGRLEAGLEPRAEAEDRNLAAL